METIYKKQKEYGFIKEISIFRNICGEECSEYNLKIILSDYPSWDQDDKFSVIFIGIRNLKLGDIDNLYKVSMDINSITKQQFENINYSVIECENELFSFLCKEIQIC